MYRTIADFENAWQMETAGTLKVLRALTDESLAQPIATGYSTLGGLAWHVTGVLGGMLRQGGLEVEGPARGTPQPSSAAEIADAYEASARSVVEAVRTAWTDESLAKLVPFFGREIPAGVMLSIAILHQTHHRGQMTVLMRQAGLRVPGLYGPSKEEHEAMLAAQASA